MQGDHKAAERLTRSSINRTEAPRENESASNNEKGKEVPNQERDQKRVRFEPPVAAGNEENCSSSSSSSSSPSSSSESSDEMDVSKPATTTATSSSTNKRQGTPTEVATTMGSTGTSIATSDMTEVPQQGDEKRRRNEETKENEYATLDATLADKTNGPGKDFSVPSVREQRASEMREMPTCPAGCGLPMRGAIKFKKTRQVDVRKKSKERAISRVDCCRLWARADGSWTTLHLRGGDGIQKMPIRGSQRSHRESRSHGGTSGG